MELEQLLEEMPDDIPARKVPGGTVMPVEHAVRQEVRRYNDLLHKIRDALRTILRARRGETSMTYQLENTLKSIRAKDVPSRWRFDWMDMAFKRLGPWLRDLVAGVEALRAWPIQAMPVTVWLGGLFDPVLLANALLRQEAQRQNISVDAFELCFEVVADTPAVVAPETGAFVKGLYLEGAALTITRT